ncbi:MAG: MlaD family protein [Bacteroidota bacterium]
MSNETKIGLLAVIVIGIFIWGYTFLKGRNILTSSKLLYVEYEEVSQLASSAPVLINGFQVGVVSDLYLKPEDMQTIVAVLNINRGVTVPKSAMAVIVSMGVMSGPGIALEFDRPCNGDGCADNGDYLQGLNRGFLGSLVPQEELDIYVGKLSEGVGTAFDALNEKIADPSEDNEIGKSFRDLQASISNLQKTTDGMNRMLAASSGKIDGILSNLNSVTGNLEASNADIQKMIKNAASFSEQLNEVEMAAIAKNANQTLAEAKVALEELKTTLETTTGTIDNVNGLVDKVNKGEGTIGKLFADDGLYNDLSNTSARIDSFLNDIEQHPYRYIPLKSRRKVKRYDKKDGRSN